MTFKVDIETVDAVRRRLAIEVPAETVTAELERAYADLSRAAKVPGFRPGRAPRAVLERMFGDRVRAEVFAKLVQQSYQEAIETQHIDVVGRPEIVTEQSQGGAPLRYRATVEVKPEIVLNAYGGFELERPLAPVTEDDVNAQLERLRQSFAQLQPLERTDVRRGDVATVDYEAHVDGRSVGSGEGREVEIGANRFPPEFDAALSGAVVGAQLEFDASYPPDQGNPELAGKTIHFHVHLRGVAEKQVPALDDEFAKDHGECSTLVELRDKVRSQLEAEAARQADEAVRHAAVTALVKAHDVAVPGAMVERRTEALMEEVVRDWQRQGIRPRNESEALARLRQELEPRAHEQVKTALLLEAVARHEQLSVSDGEIDEYIASLAAGAGAAADRVRALYQHEEMRPQLRTRLLQARAVDILVKRANVRTVAPHPSVADVSESR